MGSVVGLRRGLPWGGRKSRIAALLGACCVRKVEAEFGVSGSEMGTNQFWPCRGGESVDGSESVFNAENSEAQSGNISDNNVANVEIGKWNWQHWQH